MVAPSKVQATRLSLCVNEGRRFVGVYRPRLVSPTCRTFQSRNIHADKAGKGGGQNKQCFRLSGSSSLPRAQCQWVYDVVAE